MPDIYLRTVPSDADSDDIRLYDPTVSDIAGGANFAGTATLTFDASATFRAPATMGGAATIVFNQTGALRAPASFAGSTSLTFTQSAAFRAASSFAGNTNLTFTQSGGLLAPATFTGATTVTFTQTGDFVAGAAPESSGVAERRGGGRHKIARYWRGKYAGYYDDIEWTEWLLAALAGDVATTPPKPKPTPSRKIKRAAVIVEPEPYIARAYPELVAGLFEQTLETLEALAAQRHSERIAALAKAAAIKKRRQEEDDIAFLLMAA